MATSIFIGLFFVKIYGKKELKVNHFGFEKEFVRK